MADPALPRGHPAYVHGTEPDEQDRLTLMNRILNRAALAELAPTGAERILELGAATGIFARDLARAGCEVVAVDRSPGQIETARRLALAAGEEGSVDLRLGDASAPPLGEAEWGSFDVAHARFLLEHLPDPDQAVRSMVRAVRPGGRVVLADDDHSLLRLWPEPAGVLELWALYARQYGRLGHDPFVGRRLVELLSQAGAKPTRNTLLFYGGCAGDERFAAVVENLARVMGSARDMILASGEVGPAALDDTLAGLVAWGGRADAALWYAIPWAEGVRPE